MTVIFEEEKQKKQLEQLRRLEEENRARIIAQKFSLTYLDLSIIPIDTEALTIIEEEKSRAAELAIIQRSYKILRIAVKNPENPETIKALEALKQKGYQTNLFVVSQRSLLKAWEQYKTAPKAAKTITGKVGVSEIQKEIASFEDLKQKIEQLPANNTSVITEIALAGGLKFEASDIHIEPEADKALMRYRIDGILQDITFLPLKIYNSLISRIKLLANLKINIHGAAQDGRFTIQLEQKEIEIRVSVIPGAYGESIVMRILDPKMISVELEELGFREDDFQIVQQQIEKPNGMILNTGPTGSGKTTTLYAFLKKLNKPGIKIITIEDPIEYHIERISQTQVEPEKDYTFANGLRSIVRQDPDVVLIGEIRDKETAEIATQTALTGHLVFSTLHTNNAPGAIPRLIEMDIKPSIISAAVNLVIAQRLVRKICKFCGQKEKISPELFMKFQKIIIAMPKRVKLPEFSDETMIAKPAENGCDKCHHMGYKGRVGIFELFIMSPEMEKLIITSQTESEIKKTAKETGMVTMLEDGVIKIIQGITTLEEIEEAVGKLE